MPAPGRTASSSGRHSRKPSQNRVSAAELQHQSQQQRREKSRSSSHIQHPRRQSPAAAAQLDQVDQDLDAPAFAAVGSSVTHSQHPPPIKGRAHSVPLAPTIDQLPNQPVEASHGAPNPTGSDAGDDDEISQDPFFQRYTYAQSDLNTSGPQHHETVDPGENSCDGDSTSSQEGSSDDNHESLLSSTTNNHMRAGPDSAIEPLGSPLSPRSPQNKSVDRATDGLQEINIAVLGQPQVGKSTFIKCAFDLRTKPPTSFTSRKMSIDGNVYVVRLIELRYNDLDLDDEKCICWPETLRNTPVPIIDGAFALYDVMNKDSLVQVPETLNGIYNAQIPFLLVACKCDYPRDKRYVDPGGVDKRAKALIGDVRTFQTSDAEPDTQKRCVAVLLRAIVSVRNQHLQPASRRRAHSSAVRQAAPISPISHVKHNRAISELSASMLRSQQLSNYRPEANPPLTTKSKSHQHLPAVTAQNHFFDVEIPAAAYEDLASDGDSTPELEKPKQAPSAPAEIGFTFDELVDRLLSQPMSKLDGRFASIFLALYRVFAAPTQLLDAIVLRFDVLSGDSIPQVIKASAQQRHLNILEQWISLYPGDFAFPSTRKKMELFIARVSSIRIFSAPARELSSNWEAVLADDDTDWGFSDGKCESSAQAQGTNGLIMGVTGLRILDDKSPLQSPVSPIGSSPILSSSQAMLSVVENAERQAKLLSPAPRFPLTKAQWHSFIDLNEETIAKELTRMDWVMFMSIRPRDLVRHVSLSAQDKSHCRSLQNVQRMIDHFNHVAIWVSNMILFRDKPKHRALMLEKMMRVARELRKLNNYNALGAILAGINNSAVHRLQTTKDLLSPTVSKYFMGLEILMAPQKSHSAYRLAWENTSGERIPYIPLHRRDLVTAFEGNKTFIGEGDGPMSGQETLLDQGKTRRINWKKFEIMGDVVVGLQRAKEVPYSTLNRCEELRSMVVEMEVEKDEDRLYDRSLQLEPGAGGKPRRFQWLPHTALSSALS